MMNSTIYTSEFVEKTGYNEFGFYCIATSELKNSGIKSLSALCSCKAMNNMTDEELSKISTDEYEFTCHIFIDDVMFAFRFDLFGLNIEYNAFKCNTNVVSAVHDAATLWFADICIDEVCEHLYVHAETALPMLILDNLKKMYNYGNEVHT